GRHTSCLSDWSSDVCSSDLPSHSSSSSRPLRFAGPLVRRSPRLRRGPGAAGGRRWWLDAAPSRQMDDGPPGEGPNGGFLGGERRDRKSTRLNSSHLGISYAV